MRYRNLQQPYLEPWELQYYTINFNCSEETLKDALQRVGDCPDALCAELARTGKNSGASATLAQDAAVSAA